MIGDFLRTRMWRMSVSPMNRISTSPNLTPVARRTGQHGEAGRHRAPIGDWHGTAPARRPLHAPQRDPGQPG